MEENFFPFLGDKVGSYLLTKVTETSPYIRKPRRLTKSRNPECLSVYTCIPSSQAFRTAYVFFEMHRLRKSK
jgi:hypothetical protein